MNLSDLSQIFLEHGCTKIYVKNLAPNDNSKNQVYLGGSFDLLNVFPLSDVTSDDGGDWKRVRFKASVDFYWISGNGTTCKAPNSQLILYPKYPEVRFSGFLSGCELAPSDLMASRAEGRLLFLGAADGKIFGFASGADSELRRELDSLKIKDQHGVFNVLKIVDDSTDKHKMIEHLARIHSLGWIRSKRLSRTGVVLPCLFSNCGGYTLEAELGITPNGYSEPDFLGWEIKQFSVISFEKLGSSVVTLFTPEPTGGFYKEAGVDHFVSKYGYKDRCGRTDRMNFGGIHKFGSVHPLTGLQMLLPGFDDASKKIVRSTGSVALYDNSGQIAAEWSFASLLKHWNRKHHMACYIPSQSRKEPEREYRFGREILMCEGTDFILFLVALAKGEIYYDPGIKVEMSTGKPVIKRRSQFRIKTGRLNNLYQKSDIVDILKALH
jgi:hypothetical protein